jgi:hypothetical protein
MPQRFLRPGLRTSERWNSVSRDAQALYIAILTLVDDYGRYDGRPSVLCGDAFSVWNEKNPTARINPQETAALCCELQNSQLIHFYEVEGKKCLQMIQWEERVRDGAKEKWPKPNESTHPQESAGIRSVPLPPSPPPSPTPTPLPAAAGVTDEQIYQQYPLKVGKPDALKAIRKAMLKVDPMILLEKTKAYAVARNGDRSFMPHPSKWFNGERYNDDPETWVRHESTPITNGKPQSQSYPLD